MQSTPNLYLFILRKIIYILIFWYVKLYLKFQEEVCVIYRHNYDIWGAFPCRSNNVASASLHSDGIVNYLIKIAGKYMPRNIFWFLIQRPVLWFVGDGTIAAPLAASAKWVRDGLLPPCSCGIPRPLHHQPLRVLDRDGTV